MIGVIDKLNRPFSRRPRCHITCRYSCNRTIYQGRVLFCVAEPFQWTSRHKSSTLFEWNRILTSITGNTNLFCPKWLLWKKRSFGRVHQNTGSPIWFLWSWSLMAIATSVNIMFSGCLWNTWRGELPQNWHSHSFGVQDKLITLCWSTS